MARRGFASDNNAGTHPEILKAIHKTNRGHVVAYGDDLYTQRAVDRFKEVFGGNIKVFFVFGGTAANVLALKATTRSHQAIICAESAHINQDECGAPENHIGSKLLTIPTPDGKITVDGIKEQLSRIGNQHHVQPKVVSLTNATELGTVYTLKELFDIAYVARAHGLIIHVDGARIANAAVSLEMELREIAPYVDVLSFGGTKNGMMYGEAVIFFSPRASCDFPYIRKQGMQLPSKMRFIAAQFEALLSHDLWRKNAAHANAMAALLSEKLSGIAEVKITQSVETNAVFATIPQRYISLLQKRYFFYVWNERTSEVRWMTSFDTTERDVGNFVRCLKKIIYRFNRN